MHKTFLQLAEDEEQLHQLLMIQDMIEDGESVEEIKVSNITTINITFICYWLGFVFLGCFAFSWIKK